MLKTIEGIYRNGKIELSGIPNEVLDETPVIVTFLSHSPVNLRDRGIDEKQALSLRGRLSAFAEDWGSKEMEIYDNYNEAKSDS